MGCGSSVASFVFSPTVTRDPSGTHSMFPRELEQQFSFIPRWQGVQSALHSRRSAPADSTYPGGLQLVESTDAEPADVKC